MQKNNLKDRKLIQKAIDLIQELEERCLTGEDLAKKRFKQIFKESVYAVAKDRNVGRTTIADIPSRALREGGVKDTKHFQDLFKKWLIDGEDELRQKLLLQAGSNFEEVSLINKFFDRKRSSKSGEASEYDTAGEFSEHERTINEYDVFLAEEFGYSRDEREFKEGKLKLRLHLRRERSSELVKTAKAIWKKQGEGIIRCTICSFSFSEKYGSLGEDFIEAHHKFPIHLLEEETKFSPVDLAPVCSNCHRMLHRRRPPFSIEEMRNKVHISD